MENSQSVRRVPQHQSAEQTVTSSGVSPFGCRRSADAGKFLNVSSPEILHYTDITHRNTERERDVTSGGKVLRPNGTKQGSVQILRNTSRNYFLDSK